MMANSERPEPKSRITRKQLKIRIFFFIWPAANLLFFSAVFHILGAFSIKLFTVAATKLWMSFALSYIAIHIAERYYSKQFINDRFWKKFLWHSLIILLCHALFAPIATIPESLEQKNVPIVPLALMLLQIALYVGVMHMLQTQENAFKTTLNMKETELKMLRAQSNPHFLFNTLNLIATEITDSPSNAKEIVYDLADLLRSNVRLARQTFTSLEAEMEIVRLYLTLQEKRFKDRLTFDIDVEPGTEKVAIPSLILQPIVENTVKHAVAPYASNAHISVSAYKVSEQLHIVFKDSGPHFEEKNVKEGDGLRIIRKTLALHYPDDHQYHLKSTLHGGEFTLIVPLNFLGVTES